MDQRDLEQEELLGDIIRDRRDVLSYLNFVEEELAHDADGSGHRMPEEEGDHDDGSGDRTEEGAVAKSGEVYILIKPMLTS